MSTLAIRGGRGAGDWQGWAALVALVVAMAMPVIDHLGAKTFLFDDGTTALIAVALIGAGVVANLAPAASLAASLVALLGAVAAAAAAIDWLPRVNAVATDPATTGVIAATPGFWGLVAAAWLLAWLAVRRLSEMRVRGRVAGAALKLVIPVIFGAGVIFLWEVFVRGFAVPFVIMPPPSAIWARLISSVPTLAADFQQTFLKAVLGGYAIGCGAGFVVAILVDRVAFLRRGLLPVGNLVSALPIIGVAPIMVMWFGFDWPSKAAVVVAMTFFPMLVNTLAGLAASDRMERDLMRTYAAGYVQSLVKLRLPAALPFIFNALKINSTLAMIGAIVAEFFGTPVVGMGFRISTEVGRMNTDMVWAEITVAAVAGSAFYGVVALIERAVTFWHPSFRQSRMEG
jgi:NitT/TauT family transport system permease protein